MSSNQFLKLGVGRYSLICLDGEVILGVERLHRDRHELVGELTVVCSLAGARTVDGVLSVAGFNLTSARARVERASLLAKQANTGSGFDWVATLEELVQRVTQAERQGEPAVRLRDIAPAGPDEQFDVDGLRLLRRHPVVLFGDGGCGKSLVGLYCAGTLAGRGLRVGYFDWEFSGEDHRVRFERLFPEMPDDVYYLRCDRPLADDEDHLNRIVQDNRLDFVVLDSIAFASDGPPEAAEVAGRLFRGLRSLSVGTLNLAHVAKSEGADQKPFGSAFWHNGARMTWHARRATESPDGRTLTVGLTNRKTNVGPILPAVTLEFTFEVDRIVVSPVNPAEVEGFASTLPLWQRMKYALKRKPLTAAALASELGAKVETIERTARRFKGVFARVDDADDGISRLALLDRRVS